MQARRLGFTMANQTQIPDNFDEMGQEAINHLFGVA
jgi:hypothetical protein